MIYGRHLNRRESLRICGLSLLSSPLASITTRELTTTLSLLLFISPALHPSSTTPLAPRAHFIIGSRRANSNLFPQYMISSICNTGLT